MKQTFKNKWHIPIIVFLIICVFLIIVTVFIKKCNYIDFFEMSRYKTENTPLVAYAYFNTVHIDDEVINLDNVLDNENYIVEQVFCVDKNKIYFCYRYHENKKVHWCLATVDTDGSKFNIVFDESFDFDNDTRYDISVSKDYKNRTGYFYDDKIIITDYAKLIEYNIKTAVCTEYKYADYNHPSMHLSWEFSDNDEDISFYKSTDKVFINKDTLSSKSDVAKKIIEKNNHNIWNGDNALMCFFDSVQVVNDDVYLICRVLGYYGSTYALVFRCDLVEQEYKYAGYFFTGDVINEDEFYIIPNR